MGKPTFSDAEITSGVMALTTLKTVAPSFGSTEENVQNLMKDLSKLAGMDRTYGSIDSKPKGPRGQAQ